MLTPTRAPLHNPRPDLISSEPEEAITSHPSEHNSVVLVGNANVHFQRQVRQKKREKLLAKRNQKVEKGTADQWTQLQARRQGGNEKDRDANQHADAFLLPIPFWGVSPFGLYG